MGITLSMFFVHSIYLLVSLCQFCLIIDAQSIYTLVSIPFNHLCPHNWQASFHAHVRINLFALAQFKDYIFPGFLSWFIQFFQSFLLFKQSWNFKNAYLKIKIMSSFSSQRLPSIFLVHRWLLLKSFTARLFFTTAKHIKWNQNRKGVLFFIFFKYVLKFFLLPEMTFMTSLTFIFFPPNFIEGF